MSDLARYQSTGPRTLTLDQPWDPPNWHTCEAYLNHQRTGRAYLDLDNPKASCELDFDTWRLPLPGVELGRLLPDTSRALLLVPLEGPRFRQRVQQASAAEADLPGATRLRFTATRPCSRAKGCF